MGTSGAEISSGGSVSTNPAGRRFGILVSLTVLLSLSSFAIPLAPHPASPAALHRNLDVLATTMAAVASALAFLRYYARRRRSFLFLCLATGLLGTCLLDGLHGVITHGFLGEPAGASLLSGWNASRLYLSAMMLVCLGASRLSESDTPRVSEATIYLGAALGAMVTAVVFAFLPDPASIGGLARPIEFIPATMFAVATLGFLRLGKWRRESFQFWLVCSLLIATICQGLVMSRSVGSDGLFIWAHVLRAISYLSILIGLLIDVYQLHCELDRTTDELRRSEERSTSGSIQDITESKRAAKRLKESSDALQRSNDELQQFAYVASHDLQEPLRAIAGYCGLLQQYYKEQLDEDGQQYLSYAVEGAKRMQTLIDSLLNLSRVRTHGKPFAPTDLNSVVRMAMKNLSIQIVETGAEVEVGALPEIMGDATQLTQLMQNLLSNAIKFHRDGVQPKIEIQADDSRSHEWLVSVRDNGIGIDPKHVDRIYTVFQRLHTREAYTGTGIGLSICKRVIERHQGRIWTESDPDQGSTFFFTIPRNLSNEQQAASERAAVSSD